MQGIPIELSGEHSASRKAAVRAYGELRESGVIDKEAFDAAVRVLRYHHPEMMPRQACNIMAEWIAPDA